MLLTMLKIDTYNFVLGCYIDTLAFIIPSLYFSYIYIRKLIIFISNSFHF